jgi:hypothetical protein
VCLLPLANDRARTIVTMDRFLKIVLLALALALDFADSERRLPPALASVPRRIWRRLHRPRYTPLVYFTVPPGLIPECDAMEKCVSKVEEELDVRVERLDVLRRPEAEAVLTLLTTRTPPFLYHRESCQVVHVAKGGRVDASRVRAWARGRYLAPTSNGGASSQSAGRGPPVVLSQESTAIDQDELLEDALLTPLQRKGKQAIRERTDERANKE